MIPLRDANPTRRPAVVTLAIVIACSVAFALELGLAAGSGDAALERTITAWGVVPARLTAAWARGDFLSWEIVTLVTSQFLHGGWLHLLGNMLFLFVFGRSMEDRFGHLRFLLIYFLGGLGGALVHIILNAGSRVPTIGASGAIAGVLGAYFISYPAARITTLIPILFFLWRVELPALVLLGYWFLIQFFSGFRMQEIQSATAGGVAWWAHVGGFVMGIILALVLPPRRRRPVIEVLT